jgi:siroheme synthase
LYLTEEEWDAHRVKREAENPGIDGFGGSEVPVIKAAEVEVVVIVDAVVGEDAGVVRGVVVSHRKMTSAVVVASWATGPMNAGPKRRRTRPTWSMKRRLH